MKDSRNRELARIHCLKKELRLTQEQYEAALWTVCTVDSSKDLDSFGRQKLIKYFESRLPRLENVPGKPPRTLGQRPMLRKIGMQLAAMSRPWNYAEAMAEHMFKKAALELCSDSELRAIIAALDKDAKRHA